MLTKIRPHFYRPQTKFAKVMFLQVSVIHSVHRGGHAWLLMGGHAWLLTGGACMVAHRGGVRGCSQGGVCGCWRGGMHGCSRGGVCGCSRGCVWLLMGGMCGCSWGGVHGCSRGGVCGCSQGGVCGCSRGGMRGCSQGGHAWLLTGGGACVFFFSMRYGQWAGGTHPTGMHSCVTYISNTARDISWVRLAKYKHTKSNQGWVGMFIANQHNVEY